MRKNEKVAEFALRVQTTYEAATKEEDRDKQILKKQFLNCLPKKMARRFKIRMGNEKESTKVRWKDILNWAQEEDQLDDQEEESKDEGIPIWATLNEEANRKGTYGDKVRFGRPVYQQNTNTREYTRQSNKRYGGEGKRCYWCNRLGHFKRECRKY